MKVSMHRSIVVAFAAGFALLLARCTTSANNSPDGGRSSASGAESGAAMGPGSGSGSASGSSSGSPSSGTSSTGDDGGSPPPGDAGGADAPSGDAPGSSSNCPANDPGMEKMFASQAVAPGKPFDHSENDPTPGDGGAPPSGWNFYLIDGAMCRDGSPFGIYVHYASTTKLFIYLEGGGACNESHFCDHNPANMNQVFPGGEAMQGQTVAGSLACVAGLQAPYTTGLFDTTNSANPVKDWSGVYVPYCTGDVHFGTADNVTINDDPLDVKMNQHFVGYKNMQKSIARLVPTFPGVNQILLTGASAGGIGAALNLGLVQDSFGPGVPVTVLDDSGPPSDETSPWPPCLQKAWRTTWGFDGSIPSDCAECSAADGSGLNKIVDYWHHKYPKDRVGLLSTTQDQVIRLFYGAGDNNCQTNDANTLVLSGGGVSTSAYEANLDAVIAKYACTGDVATYLIGPSSNYPDATLH